MKKEIITHRQFNILMHLDETAGWISSEEIGTYIGCSYKTIQNEIRTIKNLLPENWTLLSKKGYGVRLLHPSDETVANIFVHDSKELIFQLINLLVNKDGYAIEEIGELLYINRNTTVQLLKQVRHIIKPFFLTLKSRPYRIEGNEGGIRFLLFEILYLQKGYSYFQSVKKHQKKCMKVKRYLEEAHGITLTHFGMHTFIEFLNICISRTKKGYSAEKLPFDISERLIDQGYFKEFNGFFILLEELSEYKIEVEERPYIYLALTYSEFDYIPSLEVALTKYSRMDIVKALEMVTTDKTLKHLYVPGNEYIEFLKFIHFLKAHLDYDFFNDKPFILKAFSLYCVVKLRSVLSMIQYLSKESILNKWAHQYPVFYKEINRICKIWEGENDFIFNKGSIMSFSLLMLDYITADKKQQPNVLFITSRSQIIGDYTLNYLKRHFDGKANFKKKCIGELSKTDPLFKNIDLIITDTHLSFPIKKIPIILIWNKISNKDLLEIENSIDLFMKGKSERIVT